MTYIHALILIAGILIGFAGGYARRQILEHRLENTQIAYERMLRENKIWRDMHPETEPEVREMMTLPVYGMRSDPNGQELVDSMLDRGMGS